MSEGLWRHRRGQQQKGNGKEGQPWCTHWHRSQSREQIWASKQRWMKRLGPILPGKHLEVNSNKPPQMRSDTNRQAYNHTMTTLGSVHCRTKGYNTGGDHKGSSMAAQSDRSQSSCYVDSKDEWDWGRRHRHCNNVCQCWFSLCLLHFSHDVTEDAGRAASEERRQCSARGWGKAGLEGSCEQSSALP